MAEIEHRIVRVRIGVDVGQKQDPSALVVTEEQDREGLPYYVSRLVQRLPLGTDYLEVVRQVVDTTRRLEGYSRSLRYDGNQFPVELVIDGTGVGLPLVDLIREQGIRPTVAIFTGGEKLVERRDDTISIGKGWMVSRLQVLIRSGRLLLPGGPEANALIAELRDYTPTINERTRNVSFDAKSGSHDDLVIALGLSVGSGQRTQAAVDTSAFNFGDEEQLHQSIRARNRRRSRIA